jgi:hypothetical protein
MNSLENASKKLYFKEINNRFGSKDQAQAHHNIATSILVYLY